MCILATGAAAAEGPLRIYYAGPDCPVKRALQLTTATELVPDLDYADCAVLVVDPDLAPEELARLGRHVRNGGGLVLYLAPDTDPRDLEALCGPGLRFDLDSAGAVLEPVDGASDLLGAINWRAAPQIRGRTRLSGPGLHPLIRVHNEPDDPVVAQLNVDDGLLYVVTAHVTAAENRPLLEWFYFNYLVYALSARAAGHAPLSFGEYPGSPMPHGGTRLAILIALLLMLGGTVAAYIAARRYSRRHPELLLQLVRDPVRYRARDGDTEWEQVGFHRGVASLMPAILNNIWLFVPITILVNGVLFGMILPTAQVRGAVSLVATFFGSIWTLLDWGTALAGQKFLSQHRVTNPGEGVKFVQLYVWWQAITGTIQVGIVVFVALYILPHTSLAYLSLFIVVHALIQFPGFFTVFNAVAMPGLHRFDHPQLIAFASAILSPVIQIAVSAAAVAWGRSHPVYDSVAGGLGLGAAGLVGGFLWFVFGFFLYRRIGLSARVLFLAHFDRRTVATALRFGAPVTGSGLLYTGAYTIQVMILTHMVLNYAEVQANFDVVCSVGMTGLVYPFLAIGVLTNSLLNSFSEAYSSGKLQLCRYYVTQCIKWGQLIAAFLMVVLFAVGDRFILGTLGEQYAQAAVWIRWFAVWAFLTGVVWTCDSALVGIGRPGLSLIAMVVEQGVRILLMFILAPYLQAFSLVFAYMVALPLKGLVSLIFLRKQIRGIEMNWWQSTFAPLAAAVVLYFALRAFGNVYWEPDKWHSGWLLAVGLIAALPPYFFLTGLLGAWDENGLDEFRRAVPMSTVGRPLAWLFLRCTETGARLSPLHNRFPTPTFAAAMAEADELTRMKVPLDACAPAPVLAPLATVPAPADPAPQP